jgi:DNA (cytosine-5)-methyltransferase 1
MVMAVITSNSKVTALSNPPTKARKVGAELTFVDLFAGCGGLALGFLQAGFEPLGAVEIDPDAAETYRRNIDDRIFQEDIAAVNRRGGWPQARVLVGGPPCQGFSQLGTRDPHDPRNRLWREYVDALDQTGAEFFVMENVPQLLKSDQFKLFRRLVEGPDRRFRIAASVLCSADYGVPQMRHRAIVFGWREGSPALPTPTHGPKSPDGTRHLTVRDALRGLPSRPTGRSWHRSRPNIRETSIIRYRAVPPDGGNRFQMQAALEAQGLGSMVPECWRRKPIGTTDVFGRLWWDRPAVTVRTEFYKPEKGRYLHPQELRPLTVREAARLQSFPDTFEFPETQPMVGVARQIGNAVPPALAVCLAEAVKAQLVGGSINHNLEGAAALDDQLERVAS